MTREQQRRQMFLMLLIAALIAVGLATLRAQEEECEGDGEMAAACVVKQPSDISICAGLEPYTYWWGFFGCENRAQLADEGITVEAETMSISDDGPFRRVRIERRYSNGSVEQLERVVWKGR